jgi:hypothetical protein
MYQILAFLERQKQNGPGPSSCSSRPPRPGPRTPSCGTTSGPVPRGQELPRGGPGPGQGGAAAAGLRQGPPQPGQRLPGAQGVRAGPGRIPEGSSAVPQLRRCAVQPRHPLSRRGQDAQPGHHGEAERSHRLLPALQDHDDLGRPVGGPGSGGQLHRRGPGGDPQGAEADRAPEERPRSARSSGRRPSRPPRPTRDSRPPGAAPAAPAPAPGRAAPAPVPAPAPAGGKK